MHVDDARTSMCKELAGIIGIGCHKMHVAGHARALTDGLYITKGERIVRHVVAVHDVKVHDIGSGGAQLIDLLSKVKEVGAHE